jgi:hypothetical protein
MDVRPPAGWYADPSNPNAQRWWDGTQWSAEYVRPAGPDVLAAADPPSGGRRGLVVTLIAATCVVAVVIATSLGFLLTGSKKAPSAIPVSTSVAASSSPVVSATPSPSQTKVPVPAGSKTLTGPDVSLVVPRTWISVPTKPGDLSKFLTLLGANDPASRAYLTAVANQLKRQRFALFALGPWDSKERLADGVNVIETPSQGATLTLVGAGVAANFQRLGASDIVEKRVRLGGRDALRVTLTLKTHPTPTATRTIHEAQYYVIDGAKAFVLTVALPLSQSLARADVIAKTFRVK